MASKTAEASDLGWPPGHWPPTVQHEGTHYTRGTRSGTRDDITSYAYVSMDDPRDMLIVFND